MKKLNPRRIKNTTFIDFIRLSKGEHSIKEVLDRSGEYVITYNKAEDGLPKRVQDKSEWD